MSDSTGSNGDLGSPPSSYLHSSSSFKIKSRFNEITRLSNRSLQSKRELFFKNNSDVSSGTGTVSSPSTPPPPVPTLKDMLKRTGTVSSPSTPPPPVPTLKDMLKRGESTQNESNNGLDTRDSASIKSSNSIRSSSNNSLEKENTNTYINNIPHI
ncbi:hypothetical protein M8J75_015449 [Diaphorina citri]|nr:hypothetical protein M8J75_015449 [Diaphorina citri]